MGSDSKDGVSEHEVHKPSIHDEGLPTFATEFGNHTTGYSTCAMEALKRMFMSSSMKASHSSWTKLFGESGSLQEHEIQGNSEFI